MLNRQTDNPDWEAFYREGLSDYYGIASVGRFDHAGVRGAEETGEGTEEVLHERLLQRSGDAIRPGREQAQDALRAAGGIVTRRAGARGASGGGGRTGR